MGSIVDRLRAPHVDPVLMCSEIDKLYVFSVFVVKKSASQTFDIPDNDGACKGSTIERHPNQVEKPVLVLFHQSHCISHETSCQCNCYDAG